MGAHRDGVARVHLGELVDHRDVREIVHPRAAQLLGPRDPEEAQLRHALHVVPRKAALQVVGARTGLHDVLREVAHHVADLEVLVGEVQCVVHAAI